MPMRWLDAREQVLENLDDESGQRYARETGTNTESFRKLDRKLKSALCACLDDYVAAGGDRFNESLPTATTSGTAGLAAEYVRHIVDVRVDNGVSTYRLAEGDVGAGGLPDETDRDLLLTVVRWFEPPQVPDPQDLLMGTEVGAAPSWDAFDEWVCARAALDLGVKDKEGDRQAILANLEARLRRSVMGAKRTPSSKPWPERSLPPFFLSGRLRWMWLPHDQELRLVFGSR